MLGSKVIASDIKEFSTPDATKYVITGSASDIKQCAATVDARFELTGLYGSTGETLSYSVLYATSEEELADEEKRGESVTNGGKTTIYPLLPNTTYYYQAKARIGDSHVALGETKVLTTNDILQNGIVDLGLSCKWAACDLGANNPFANGVRYAFAETETKEDFYGGNYIFQFLNEFAGAPVDISGTEYDAATHILGQPWRIPTPDEVKELLNSTQIKEATYNEIYGAFYMAENGNAIFISNNWHWASCFYRDRVSSLMPDGAFCFSGKALTSMIYYDGLYIRPVQ